MATQTVALSKQQIVQAITSAALTAQGVDPNTAGLTTAVRIQNELDVPAHIAFPKAVVTITVP